MESAGDENHPSRKRITQLSNESEVVFVVSAQTAARPQLQTSAVYCCGQDCPPEELCLQLLLICHLAREAQHRYFAPCVHEAIAFCVSSSMTSWNRSC